MDNNTLDVYYDYLDKFGVATTPVDVFAADQDKISQKIELLRNAIKAGKPVPWSDAVQFLPPIDKMDGEDLMSAYRMRFGEHAPFGQYLADDKAADKIPGLVRSALESGKKISRKDAQSVNRQFADGEMPV